MNTCPSCGHQRLEHSLTCPECGRFYSKIIELIEQQALEEMQNTWQARWQRIYRADNKRHALRQEWQQLTAQLSSQAWLALTVIGLFVFALIVTVL